MSEWASKRLRESSGGGNDKSDGEAMVVIKERDWSDSSKERDRFSVALYATEERSPEGEKLYAGQNRGEKKIKKINK